MVLGFNLPDITLPRPRLPALPPIRVPNISKAGDFLGGLANGIAGAPEAAADAFTGGLRGAGARLGDAGGAALDAAGSAGRLVADNVGGVLTGAGQAIGGFLGGLGDKAQDALLGNLKWIILGGSAIAVTAVGAVVLPPLLSARKAKKQIDKAIELAKIVRK